MTSARDFAECSRGVVIAAAGCGKTELIAQAVRYLATSGRGRQLVLTHTHAGVRALRDRLRRYEVPATAYHVDTIAGAAWRWVRSYPKRAECALDHPTGNAWNEVYPAATRLAPMAFFRDVLQQSALQESEWADVVSLDARHTALRADSGHRESLEGDGGSAGTG